MPLITGSSSGPHFPTSFVCTRAPRGDECLWSLLCCVVYNLCNCLRSFLAPPPFATFPHVRPSNRPDSCRKRSTSQGLAPVCSVGRASGSPRPRRRSSEWPSVSSPCSGRCRSGLWQAAHGGCAVKCRVLCSRNTERAARLVGHWHDAGPGYLAKKGVPTDFLGSRKQLSGHAVSKVRSGNRIRGQRRRRGSIEVPGKAAVVVCTASFLAFFLSLLSHTLHRLRGSFSRTLALPAPVDDTGLPTTTATSRGNSTSAATLPAFVTSFP
jgi:hypothetical protein